MSKRYRYIRIADGLSGLLNVILFNGECDESVSGRAWRCGWQSLESWIDFVLGRGHCRKAYHGDVTRASRLLRNHAKHKQRG